MRSGLTLRALARASLQLIREQWLLFAILAAWTLFPIAQVLIHAARDGGVVTGAYGSDAYDQLAYLAWIPRFRLPSPSRPNLWRIGGTPHDYLHPMYFVSGLLLRVGASVQLAYLVWVPVALLTLFLGFAAYVRRLIPESRRAQSAALALALFYLTPVLSLAVWTGHLSAAHRFDLALASDDADSALNLWGFPHTAIAIGLMPVCLIACERLIRERRGGGRPSLRWTVLAGASGALVSWLHPWQGAMLVAILVALAALVPPRRRYVAVLAPLVLTALPLIYGVVLSGRSFLARLPAADHQPADGSVVGPRRLAGTARRTRPGGDARAPPGAGLDARALGSGLCRRVFRAPRIPLARPERRDPPPVGPGRARLATTASATAGGCRLRAGGDPRVHRPRGGPSRS